MRTPLLLILWMSYVVSLQAQKEFSPDILTDPQKFAKIFESKFIYKEVEVYSQNTNEKSVYLKNGYASSAIQSPVHWPLKAKQYFVKEIRIIFTKYPVDKNFWNTNYYDLLAARLNAVFAIDARLNNTEIIYTLVLQTGCKSSDEAKDMMHAVEIVYELGTPPTEKTDEKIDPLTYTDSLYMDNPDSLAWINDMNKASKFFKKSKAKDTVVLKGLDAFKLKDSLLIVIDCTGSMAPYYSQVSLWAARNFSPNHYYVMFNDAGSRLLPLGNTGGYEEGRVKSVSELIKLLKKASGIKGANKESAENDVEGLLAGIKAFPDNRGIILVADNAVCVRDYKLLLRVKQPVHVIPCGYSDILNPQFLNIAHYTGGSVFWMDEYINNWAGLCTGDVFAMGSYYYRYIRHTEKFELLDNQGNHVNQCDGYTPKLNKKKKD